MRVALVQMDIALGRPEINRSRVASLVKQAAQDADLVMLPEMWTTGYSLQDLAGRLADREGLPTGPLLSDLAQQNGIYLIGSTADERDGQVYNVASVYGPNGQRLVEYAKIHLVPMMNEHLYLTAGDTLAITQIGPFQAGLAICYDLRFPELFRTLALGGAQLLLLPSEWPAQRMHHWRTLLVARAIENQSFVVACNRVGTDGANQFTGGSMVVDPWGTVLAEGGEQEEILRAVIQPEMVAEIRHRIPVFKDRRPDAYRLRS